MCKSCGRYFREFDYHDYIPYIGPIKLPKRQYVHDDTKGWRLKPIGPFAIYIFAKLRYKDDVAMPQLKLEIYFWRWRIFIHKFVV